MPTYEEQVRREMEQAAAAPSCPIKGDVDGAFGMSDPTKLKRAQRGLKRATRGIKKPKERLHEHI